MKRVLVTLNQVNRIIQENFKRRLFEEDVKIKEKSDFESVGLGGVNNPEDVKHIIDLFSHEKVGMAKEIQDVIKKCSSEEKTLSSTETTPVSTDTKSPSSSDKSVSDLVDAIVSSDSKSTTSTTSSDTANKSYSETSDIDYTAIGNCADFHNLIGSYQKDKVFSTGFSDSRIDTGQATINTLYGEILGFANIAQVNVADIKELNSNEKIVLKVLKEKGFTDEGSAAVMGVVGGESGFQTFKELSYSTTSNDRIRNIFSSKLGNKSDAELNKLKQSDEAFFNAVYGGMYGNLPNEGYKYVGRGFNGITFKGNYEAAQKCTGIGFVGNPELMEKPENAAAALACYFDTSSVKNATDLEKAFQEAYRRNAGGAYSFAVYANSQNTVNKVGIPLKWAKAQKYYKKIKETPTT